MTEDKVVKKLITEENWTASMTPKQPLINKNETKTKLQLGLIRGPVINSTDKTK